MKLAACFLTLLHGFAVAASWTSPGFPAFSEQGTGTFVSHAQLPKGTRPLTLNFDQQCWQPADAIKLNQMLSLQPCSNTPPQWRLFRDGEYTLQIDTRSGTPTLMISIQNAAEPVASWSVNARNGMDYRSQWMSAPLSRKEPPYGIITASKLR